MELIRDNMFTLGFDVYPHDIGRFGRSSMGRLQFGNPEEIVPAWHVAQWHCCSNLLDGSYTSDKNLFSYTDVDKTFTVRKGEGAAELELRASEDYKDRPREQGEPWPHILIAQSMPHPIKVSQMSRLDFSMSFDIIYVKNLHKDGIYDNKLHAAQFVWFVAVANRNPSSAGFGDYFWFGLPQYDVRHKKPLVFRKKDDGKNSATGKYIYTLDGSCHLPIDPLPGGQTVNYTYPALNDVLEGFKWAKDAGFLKDTRWEDLAISSMNTGLENPGTFDLAVRINKISIDYDLIW